MGEWGTSLYTLCGDEALGWWPGGREHVLPDEHALAFQHLHQLRIFCTECLVEHFIGDKSEENQCAYGHYIGMLYSLASWIATSEHCFLPAGFGKIAVKATEKEASGWWIRVAA